ncbi:DivIVA domain-containing protein [Streptomyces sp900105755]|uniref:DivIVA domain-containing protein n=1 Tax=unclassified Streptomyces TaxID=2593676 RepID=UPI000AF5F1A5|nr:DivIVA domain-containing protein [Streptomyces sp. Ag109_O5-10]
MAPEFHGFEIVRRGYDRAQVDAYLALLVSGTAPDTPPAFDVVRRGYDRAQVDARLAEWNAPR